MSQLRSDSINARADQAVQGADALRLGTHRTTRPILCVPGVQIEVQPGWGCRDEPLEEQRSNDRAGERRRRNVAEVGNLARELVLVAGPQRQRPDRIRLLL